MAEERESARKGGDESRDEKPFVPGYKGFDAERTQRAQRTAERAQEGASAKGMDANNTYVDEGPDEAARRTGRSKEDIGESIEHAAERGKK